MNLFKWLRGGDAEEYIPPPRLNNTQESYEEWRRRIEEIHTPRRRRNLYSEGFEEYATQQLRSAANMPVFTTGYTTTSPIRNITHEEFLRYTETHDLTSIGLTWDGNRIVSYRLDRLENNQKENLTKIIKECKKKKMSYKKIVEEIELAVLNKQI